MVVNFNQMWVVAREAADAGDDPQSVQALSKILSIKEGRRFISTLDLKDAKLCIEILHHALFDRNLPVFEKQLFLSTLRRLSGKHARLPYSMVIDEIAIPGSSQVYTSGGFADIKVGKYKGHAVAIKMLRVAEQDDFKKIRKQFCQEVILWNSLSHPNVLKLVGVLDGFGKRKFATVSEWMEHGNIMEYIRKNYTNRMELLYGAVEGLRYLHEANLTHGDLKGANILMTNDKPPKACLADFGFTSMVLDPENPMSCSLTLEGGTVTFMAPELLAPSKFGLEKAVPTKEGDIYAFGLVILQVLTGQQPFRNIKPRELPYYVSLGARPDKPENPENIGISDSLWRLIQKCWEGDKRRRPQIQEVVEGMSNAASNWHTETPPSDPDNQEEPVSEEDSDPLEHQAIFEPYEPSAGLNTPPSSYGSRSPAPNRHKLAKKSKESFDLAMHSHLRENHPSPPSAIPPPKRKGLKHYLKRIFGRRSSR